MDRLYDLNSVSRIYREEALREARRRHLVEQAKGSHRPRFGLRDIACAVSGATNVLRW